VSQVTNFIAIYLLRFSGDISEDSRPQVEQCVPEGSAGEKILGYVTTRRSEIMQGRRITMWLAPALDCFALRMTIEEPRSDGGFRLIWERSAVQVNER
jgi:hypothetical protein